MNGNARKMLWALLGILGANALAWAVWVTVTLSSVTSSVQHIGGRLTEREPWFSGVNRRQEELKNDVVRLSTELSLLRAKRSGE
jgi:hypothetical protein